MRNELSKTEIKEIKISQNKLDEFSDEITNATEIIESSMKVLSSVSLTKHTINGDFDEWKKQQKNISTREKINKACLEDNVLAFDIYKNGELLIKDADDFITYNSHYQDVYLIKNIIQNHGI